MLISVSFNISIIYVVYNLINNFLIYTKNIVPILTFYPTSGLAKNVKAYALVFNVEKAVFTI
jgi:hypothetical protein